MLHVQEYRGVTLKQAQVVLQKMSEKMFDMFDREPSEYKSGNRSLSLMWAVGFTASVTAREAIDRMHQQKITLRDAWIHVLADNTDGYLRSDLLKLL